MCVKLYEILSHVWLRVTTVTIRIQNYVKWYSTRKILCGDSLTLKIHGKINYFFCCELANQLFDLFM